MRRARKTAVVICPGRGTYNKAELGYLARYFPDGALLRRFDRQRDAAGQDTLTQLDGAERFSVARHTRGDNASAIIYAATLGDFRSIDGGRVDVVAVTGNSMGWYSALACARAVTAEDGFTIANTMGTLMQDALIGGQLVHPFMGDDWIPDAYRRDALLELAADIDGRDEAVLLPSIHLGGMLVLAGNTAGLTAFERAVEPIDGRFPMRLGNHAAFHTHMQEPVARRGRDALPPSLFGAPRLPLIDGRGAIWWPDGSDPRMLRDYTFGHQVTQTYDFTRAIEVAAREFAPDLFIVTGPGTTLGGAVAQSLVLADWEGIGSKAAFKTRQERDPILIAMGMPGQRDRVV